MPEITIIFPCFNSIAYLKEAIDSVLNQNLKDFELLVIDAGSTDGTLELLKNHHDDRIRFIHSDKKSHGVQCNIGIENARGKYIGFFESDDILPAEAYERLHQLIIKHDVDYVKGDFERFITLPDNERIGIKHSSASKVYQNRILSHNEIEGLRQSDIAMWNGLYKKRFLMDNNIRLDSTPGASFQDFGFYFQQILYAENAYYTDLIVYQYRLDNPNNSTHSKNRVGFIDAQFRYAVRCINYKTKKDFTETYIYLLEKFYLNLSYYLIDWFVWNPHSAEAAGICKEFYSFYLYVFNKLDENEKKFLKIADKDEFHLFIKNFSLWLDIKKEYLCTQKSYIERVAAVICKKPNIAICYNTDFSEKSIKLLYSFLKKRSVRGRVFICNLSKESINILGLRIVTLEDAITENCDFIINDCWSAEALYISGISPENVYCLGMRLTEVWDYL